MRMKLPWLPMMTKRFSTTRAQPQVSTRAVLQRDPNPYYSSCCLDPQPLLCNFSDAISGRRSVSSVLWACGQHSSPPAPDPGFLTRPPVSFPETADASFDPRARFCGSEPRPTRLQEASRCANRAGRPVRACPRGGCAGCIRGGPSLLLITAGGRGKGEKCALLAGRHKLRFSSAEPGAR